MYPGLYQLLADAVVLVHAGFVLFVVFGGFLVLRWPWVIYLQVPAVAWGITVEWAGWICPLTPVENLLRERGGMAPYRGDFIERHLLPLLYPAQLTRGMQLFFGGAALALNMLIYWRFFARRRRALPFAGSE